MVQLDLIGTLIQLVGGLLAILILVLGWIGTRIHARLDEINKTLGSIERDLRGELTNLDRRVTKVEAHIDNCPGNSQ